MNSTTLFTFSVFDDTRYAARIGRGLSACGAEDGGDIRRFDVRIFSVFDGGVYHTAVFPIRRGKGSRIFYRVFSGRDRNRYRQHGDCRKSGRRKLLSFRVDRRFRLCRGGFYNLLFHIFAYLR